MQITQAFLSELKKYSRPADVAFMERFFKTGKGEYGEGDQFIAITVPNIRKVCKEFKDISLLEIEELLESPIHEVREGAVYIMAGQAASKKSSPQLKKDLYNLYLRRTDRINNWDIVDGSCRDVVGGYLFDKSRAPLYKLAKSQSIWERRIAIVSTWYFIREKDLCDTFKIAEMLLQDKQDLIHKATGWMLREAGKKDRPALLKFLDKHAATMPRTALRYAIEHLDTSQKLYYMGARKAGLL